VSEVRPIIWEEGRLLLLDQRLLPDEERYIDCSSTGDVACAIKNMIVRGAPAIGTAAAFGMALAVKDMDAGSRDEALMKLDEAAELLANTRPTAVNLFWAIRRMQDTARRGEWLGGEQLYRLLWKEAEKLASEDIAANRAIGANGQAVLPSECRVMTYCNAGALATAGYGTALGVIRAGATAGKVKRVYACETRPFLQGARLTAWELLHEGIPVTLITDNMAGLLMRTGKVDVIVVGADRIAANGDVANKIGTYTLAVVAEANDIPFYVAAPLSTVDLEVADGDEIPIEERPVAEVIGIRGQRIAPEGVDVCNPAFDVTPSRYINGIITEVGIIGPPYGTELARAVSS